MTLGEKQRIFARQQALLTLRAFRLGYAVTLGASFRDPSWNVGHPKSLHGVRLAVDLNLFVRTNGSFEYASDTESHRPLGEYWESRSGWYLPNGSKVRANTPNAEVLTFAWGGRFEDGNHYSIAHNGMK